MLRRATEARQRRKTGRRQTKTKACIAAETQGSQLILQTTSIYPCQSSSPPQDGKETKETGDFRRSRTSCSTAQPTTNRPETRRSIGQRPKTTRQTTTERVWRGTSPSHRALPGWGVLGRETTPTWNLAARGEEFSLVRDYGCSQIIDSRRLMWLT